MTSRDFCFWLQGFFELHANVDGGITSEQAAAMKAHLALVFKHEIDLSMGGPEKQADLNQTHNAHKPSFDPNSILVRC